MLLLLLLFSASGDVGSELAGVDEGVEAAVSDESENDLQYDDVDLLSTAIEEEVFFVFETAVEEVLAAEVEVFLEYRLVGIKKQIRIRAIFLIKLN